MNDQIKDFVEQHREEFDHLEAPVFDMERFKRRPVETLPQKAKIVRFLNNSKWLVAASVVLVAATAWLFFYQQAQVQVTKMPNGAIVTVKQKAIDKAKGSLIADTPSLIVEEIKTAGMELVKVKNVKKQHQFITNKDETYKGLKDSSSASVRLLAILNIEKSNKINNKTLKMLSETLNHDGNTNVRLAALSVLQKYSTDKYASSLLISSLNKQDDPMVQLGLVSFLGKRKDVEIGDKLYALANNPETFAAVRDEAYSILLNQDKL